MDRRKYLLGLGSLAAGGAATMGTGAFTRVKAERTVTVDVVGDDSAMLTMDGNTGSPNSEYSQFTGNGTITVDLTNALGDGLNRNAETTILRTFRIKNEGTQPAFVYVDPESVSPDRVTADPNDDGSSGYEKEGGIYLDPQASDRPNEVNFTGQAISMTGIYGVFDATTGFAGTNTYDAADLTIGQGQSLNFGLFIHTEADIDYTADVSMEIVADADLAANI